jgi:hypothetical protein
MTSLRFIVEPSKLLMTWQPSDESGQSRLRRLVAEISRDDTNPLFWRLKYLVGTPDFESAVAAGFQGHPAFKVGPSEITQGVRETLLRRLPPRNRDDFSEFLAMHRLPDPFPGSDLALLGYTGAKLPSDGFSFVPLLDSDQPCEYILEVAGLRHVFRGELEQLRVGDLVTFVPEPSNEIDAHAIAVYDSGHKLGYVNRALLPTFHGWMTKGPVSGVIERKNGNPERPLIYVRIRAGRSTEEV